MAGTIWRAKQEAFDDHGRTIVEHEDVRGVEPSRFLGTFTRTSCDFAGNPVQQQAFRFEINAPTLIDAFANYDVFMQKAIDDLQEAQKKAAKPKLLVPNRPLAPALGGRINGSH